MSRTYDPGADVVPVKLARSQVAALLILLEQTDLTPYPAALRSALAGADHQLKAWQRAASPEDAADLD